MVTSSRGTLTALFAAALLAGCAGSPGSIPSQATQAMPAQLALPDLTRLPKCKGQKTTTDYASGPAQGLSFTNGGTLCVPLFKGWGGSMSYPGTTSGGFTASLTSSTTAYAGAFWPPNEPFGTPIFYIQFNVNNGGLKFGTNLPKGGQLASAHLKVNKPYTLVADLYYASLWQGLGECSIRAREGKYGPYITGVGEVFSGREFFGGTEAVVTVYQGNHSTTKC